jgi:hypothetical protein
MSQLGQSLHFDAGAMSAFIPKAAKMARRGERRFVLMAAIRQSERHASGPDLTTDDFPHNQGHLIFKLLTFVIGMLPQGVTVAAIQPKVIDYRRRTENYTKKKETHFVRALP